MKNEIYDVVQIGYGPVGQTMADLLGKTGHSVAVFERWPLTFSLPRAATFDHEIMRVFKVLAVLINSKKSLFLLFVISG